MHIWWISESQRRMLRLLLALRFIANVILLFLILVVESLHQVLDFQVFRADFHSVWEIFLLIFFIIFLPFELVIILIIHHLLLILLPSFFLNNNNKENCYFPWCCNIDIRFYCTNSIDILIPQLMLKRYVVFPVNAASYWKTFFKQCVVHSHLDHFDKQELQGLARYIVLRECLNNCLIISWFIEYLELSKLLKHPHLSS